MKIPHLRFISLSLKYILLFFGIAYFIIYLVIVSNRISYPFELEWIEGSMVDHVQRIISGQNLYVSPTIEFVPFLYTPLYFYVSAVVANIIGIGFLPLRIVSFGASLGCLCAIFLITRNETKSTYFGVLASSLFVATYRIGGAWLDIARVDSFYLFLLLTALYLVKFKDSPKLYFLAGILMSFSFLTKQTALYVCLTVAGYSILVKGWRSCYFIAPVVVIIGSSTYLLNYITDGWYAYYVFKVPTYEPILKANIIQFWTRDVFSSLPVACSIALFYMLMCAVKTVRKNFYFYILTSLGLFCGAWFSRMRLGGYDNVLIPAYAILAVLFGIGLQAALNLIQSSPAYYRKIAAMFLYIVCLVQFFSLIYNPFHQVPNKMDLDAGTTFIKYLSTFKGDILVPGHSFLPELAGKKSYAHVAAVADVLFGDHTQAKALLTDSIVKGLQEKRFSALILDKMWYCYEPLELYYTIEMNYNSPTAFLPVTGGKTRPTFICLPKQSNAN
jgi:hypothetical protein